MNRAPGEARRAPAGLLLGLQSIEAAPAPLPYYAEAPDSLAAPNFRTLFFTRTARDFQVADSTRGLYVPRRDTLWRVGIKRSVYNNWVEDFLWAVPLGGEPQYAGISTFNGEYCEGHRTLQLRFAGRRFLSYEQRSAGTCEGSAHPWYYNTLGVIPIDSTDHLGLPVEEVLGEAALDSFELVTNRFLDSLARDEQELYAPEPDPANWAVVRRAGEWTVIGRLGPVSEAVQDVSADFYLDLPTEAVPAPLGRGLDPELWDALSAAHDDLRDALLSPDGRRLVVLTADSLTTYARQNEDTWGPPLYDMPLPPRTTIITFRWMSNREVRRMARLAHRRRTVTETP